MEDYKVNKRDLNYKRRGRPKMDYFGLQTRDYGKERKRKEKKRKKGEIKQRYGFLYGYMTFAWILVCFLYTNYLGMDC